MTEKLRWTPPTYTVDAKGKVMGYVNKDVNNWGKWGPDDERGTLNYIDPQTVIAATKLVKRGKVINLALNIDPSAPFNRATPIKWMSSTSADGMLLPTEKLYYPGLQVNDDWITMPLQCSTQWDGLSHFCYEDVMYNGFWGGDVSASQGLSHLGIHQLREHLVGRGVLLDIARYKGLDFMTPGMPVTAQDLEGCAKKQNVQIKRGDILLIRTGHLERWPKVPLNERMAWIRGGEPGMGVSSAGWLHEKQVAAIAVDNSAAEVTPFEDPKGPRAFPWHVQVIRNLGMQVGEYWKLDVLSQDCAQDGVYEFFLSAPPLNITNAVGSPISPVAIK